jgi:hypothetical protein
MDFSIAEFWESRFRAVDPIQSHPRLPGWSFDIPPNPSFVEAELRLRPDCSDLSAPIWLVAAPGAVGKSTLAREICAQTHAMYLDLSRADTVAGNYLTGGLVKNDVFSQWREGRTSVLIDALDEARLRVTEQSFEDFLDDIKSSAEGRETPVVLLGRLGIIDEVLLILQLKYDLSCPVFDIDFFDQDRAGQFVISTLDRLATLDRFPRLRSSIRSHRATYEKTAKAFVKALADVAATDGTRFAGYAPVLEAVATVLAVEPNPMHLDDTVQEILRERVLHDLTNKILEREATKLQDQLPELVPSEVRRTLYSTSEQLDRLASAVLGTPPPDLPSVLEPDQLAIYDNAVKALLPQHPFLDGTGRAPSGAVFSAAISSHALFSTRVEVRSAAEVHAGRGPHTPNPFLIDFYLDRAERDLDGNPIVPPEHVIALYESVRSRAAAGEIVRLSAESEEGEEPLDVEIQIGSGVGSQAIEHRVLLKSSQAGTLRFGRQVGPVSIDAPELDVIIGAGGSVELVAPTSIAIGRLTLDCTEVVVQAGDVGGAADDNAVVIEAHELVASKVTRTPTVRQDAELYVSWPGASVYPWTSFAAAFNGADGPDIGDTLRAIRRLMMAFRSHSKGRLARFEDKIEHRRITKGELGVAVRKQLLADGVLTLEGEMYFLDPNRLGQVVGATYQDLKMRRFNERVREYAKRIRH